MHERIDLARGVIAGEHRLTIQLLRDIDSRAERGIVFIWPSAPTVIQQAELAAVRRHCCCVGCGTDPARSDQS